MILISRHRRFSIARRNKTAALVEPWGCIGSDCPSPLPSPNKPWGCIGSDCPSPLPPPNKQIFTNVSLQNKKTIRLMYSDTKFHRKEGMGEGRCWLVQLLCLFIKWDNLSSYRLSLLLYLLTSYTILIKFNFLFRIFRKYLVLFTR